jgi:two-component system, NarL family, nitrate/nitrite response regulator NarL
MFAHTYQSQDNPWIRVVVSDARPMDCQLLARCVAFRTRLRVVGSATSSAGLVAVTKQTTPDVVLISARLDDGATAGLFALRALRKLPLQSRMVILLDEEEPELVLEAYRNGARGVFCRTEPSWALRKCVQSVRNGQIWASNAQREYIVGALMQVPTLRLPATDLAVRLSKREKEIACMAAAGMTNLEISQELGLSHHTIKNNLFRIFQKLGVSTRTELVLYMVAQRKQLETEASAAQSLAKMPA